MANKASPKLVVEKMDEIRQANRDSLPERKLLASKPSEVRDHLSQAIEAYLGNLSDDFAEDGAESFSWKTEDKAWNEVVLEINGKKFVISVNEAK